MPYKYSEMQNKLSKTRESPLESMGQIISSQCPEGARVATRLYIDFSDVQGLITPVNGGIWPKFELIQAFMPARMKKIEPKIKALLATAFLPL